MALTHVCIWDSKIGFRRTTIGEALEMYPYGTTAKSGHFACELCAQNVLLTKPGKNSQHFRHDPASPNKECDERQASFDPTYGRSIRSLNSHVMPLRLVVNETDFSLQLGFFYPPDANAHCDRIKIAGDSHQTYEYSFERIERIGTTYLNVGSTPSRVYGIEYVNANMALKRFWSNKVRGINPTGSFFDGRTGQILQSGGKAYSENFYYLLQRGPLYSLSIDIEVTEIARLQTTTFSSWYLYKIHIKKFSKWSAKFFLKYAIFLTEKPTKFYPIWPAYIAAPYFIYHNSSECYFYLCGDDAELKAYPAATNTLTAQDRRLYKLYTREKEQLVSFGKSGALGFSYLIRRPLNKKAQPPTITISDYDGNTLVEASYTKIPKKRQISVSSLYDGRAIIRKDGKTILICRLPAMQTLEIDNISFGTEILFYQGCDCVKILRFERSNSHFNSSEIDKKLFHMLNACRGPSIPVPHTIGIFALQHSDYPKTVQWIRKTLRCGEICRDAYQILKKYENQLD